LLSLRHAAAVTVTLAVTLNTAGRCQRLRLHCVAAAAQQGARSGAQASRGQYQYGSEQCRRPTNLEIRLRLSFLLRTSKAIACTSEEPAVSPAVLEGAVRARRALQLRVVRCSSSAGSVDCKALSSA